MAEQPMLILKVATTIALVSCVAAAHAQDKKSPEVVAGYLSALAYSCEQLSMIARLDTDHSNYQAFLDKQTKKVTDCVERSRADGKSAYQEAMTKQHEHKELLARVYARWLGHLQTLIHYFEEEDQKRTKAELQGAINDLQAAIDAQPPTI